MTDLLSRIAALSPRQRGLLEQRLADRLTAESTHAREAVVARDRSKAAPLSIQQEREWAFGRFRGANNIIGAFRVEGALDRHLLGDALTAVVDRHEVLRSTFERLDDGTWVQVVQPLEPVPVPVEDISHLDEAGQHAEIHRRWVDEVVSPFDQAARHRLRISLLRLGSDRHVALITTDHVAGDLASMDYLIREFAAQYVMRRGGATASLPPPEVQYADFASWQREVEARRRDAEREHWHRALEGVPDGLALPSDRPLPVAPTFAGGEVEQQLPADLAARLREFAEQERASLAVVLSAAAVALLHRYTGREDLVLGEVLFGRNTAETEAMIGCFVGALPLHTHVTDDMTMRQVVAATRATVVTAYEHKDLPVDAMLDDLGLEQGATVGSLIDMWIDVSTPPTRLEVPGLSIVPEPMESVLAPTPLTLAVSIDTDSVELRWLYMTEMFDGRTVELLAEQFHRVLRATVADPDTVLAAIGLLDSAPKCVDPPAPSRRPADVVEGFERSAREQPDAAAVVCDGVVTSYADLDRASGRLAQRLRALGVGPEVPVGVVLDRSPVLAEAVLGVLKSGGAYVPLDSGHPPARIAATLVDAGVRVVLTHARFASSLPAADTRLTAAMVLVDEPGPTGGSDASADGRYPSPDSLAYVVYTSGSSGWPKGAMVQHGSLAVYAADVRDRLGLSAGDRFLQFASPGFDVLAEELFPVWLAGGSVVFPPRPSVPGIDELLELIEREQITVVELPTAYWHEWVRELDRQRRELPDGLRTVIIGGERIVPERLALWPHEQARLVHCYGLTETTVTSTFFTAGPHDTADGAVGLPIGTPLPSVDLRVLDRRLRPVPVGAAGELYLAGSSLARGYLGRPSLTAQRFLADPDVAGGRMYRTGDLGRQRADGVVEFLSRIDAQLKVRGFRIEPTEIESAITRHPLVSAAVVTSFEPEPGDRRLAAYLVPAPNAALDTTELRAHLARELPAYMIPSVFVELEDLPLTTNGKVDRGALPEPAATAATGSSVGHVGPQTPLQELLAVAIAEVIGVDSVGIHDNFFEIGGDSILAIQFVTRVQQHGLRLTPFDVFANPTVEALADIAGSSPAVDAEQGDVSGPAPVAPGQRWLCDAGRAHSERATIGVLADLPAPIDPELIELAVNRLMIHHDGLRQRILVAGDRTRARIAPRGDATPFVVQDVRALDADEQARWVADAVDALRSGLDLALGPLVRVGLFRRGPRRDQVALVAHRLVADETSLRILLEDLGTVLAQLNDGRTVELPPKTTSWQSWARRLAKLARGEQVQAQREFWTTLVAEPVGHLPTVPGAAAVDTVGAARSTTAALSPEETDQVFRAAELLRCDVVDLLLVALGGALRSWTGHDRHLIGYRQSGREPIFDDVDLRRTVGVFECVRPVLLACPSEASAPTAVRSVRECLGAAPAPLIGWELLRTGPDPAPDPRLDVTFAFRPEQPNGASWFTATEPVGGGDAEDDLRQYPVDVQASVAQNVLRVRWTYGDDRHDGESVRRAAERLTAILRELASAATGLETRYHPEDFPLANVDQQQLDALLSRLQPDRSA